VLGVFGRVKGVLCGGVSVALRVLWAFWVWGTTVCVCAHACVCVLGKAWLLSFVCCADGSVFGLIWIGACCFHVQCI